MQENYFIEQVKKGNTHAFKFIVANHQKLVVHIVGRIVLEHDEIEDVCQEVFIKVFQKITEFKGESRFSTWIASIAYHQSLNYLRKKRRLNETSFDEDVSILKIATAVTPEEIFANNETKRIVKQIIESLPLTYRTVVTLFYLEEFSYTEIVQITGMTEGTIKSHLFRARNLLKEKLMNSVLKEK
ncbi:MAG: sigma-70 family RNA polymerase sigma factor [Bacteroidetes bacterium]|nr:sigma-70 family RNA polymerase sigma factor [Bacteroidota bacterium]